MKKEIGILFIVLILLIGIIFLFNSQLNNQISNQNLNSTCPINEYATAVTTTTLNCASASNTNYLTTQTNEYYGSCPVNQYATAVTTTTLNCASASNTNYLTTQTSAFFSYEIGRAHV